jgi:molybdopterin synthase sulfur carrier subunit
MTVRVSFYATLRGIVGGRSVELPVPYGSTAHQMLRQASTAYPALAPLLWRENGELSGYIKVFVGGREIAYLNGLGTVIPEGADVDIFPPVAGG